MAFSRVAIEVSQADELVHGRGGGRGRGGQARFAVSEQQLDDLLPGPVVVHPGRGQQLRRATAFADEAEQDVLGADVVVAELVASRRDSSSTFLAPGVNGMCPDSGGGSAPRPILSSTACRISSRLMPIEVSAVVATPAPSSMRPSRMCSVPM